MLLLRCDNCGEIYPDIVYQHVLNGCVCRRCYDRCVKHIIYDESNGKYREDWKSICVKVSNYDPKLYSLFIGVLQGIRSDFFSKRHEYMITPGKSGIPTIKPGKECMVIYNGRVVPSMPNEEPLVGDVSGEPVTVKVSVHAKFNGYKNDCIYVDIEYGRSHVRSVKHYYTDGRCE